MIYLLLTSFFYSDVIYRLPVGSYGYVLISDIVSWVVIFFILFRNMFIRIKARKFDRLDWSLLVLNILMFLLLIQIYFTAVRTFSELGRAAADTLRFTQFIVCFYAVRSYMRASSKALRYLIWVFALATAVSVFGLIVDVGMQLPRMYAGITINSLRPKEFSAFFTNNHASASIYLLAAFSLGFGLILMKKNSMLKGLAVSGMAVIILAIIFSKSRSGILGLGISTVFFLLYYIRFRGGSILAWGGIILMAVIFGAAGFYSFTDKGVMDRVGISSVEDVQNYERRADYIHSYDRKIGIISIRARFQNWRESIGVIKDMSFFMFFGYGVNQQSYKVNLGGAHNNFMQVIIDLGIVGLVFFLIFLYEVGKLLRKPRNIGDSDLPYYAMRIGMRCGFFGIIGTALTQETFYMAPAMGNFFGFYLILLAIVDNIKEKSVKKEEIPDGQSQQISNAVYKKI